jgi:hypothetical protein
MTGGARERDLMMEEDALPHAHWQLLSLFIP